MSIDARVIGITKKPDGTARLALEQRDRSRCAGRSELIVIDPPTNLAILLNKDIWGGSGFLMCGEIEIGERTGYSECRIDYASLIKVASHPDIVSQDEDW